MTSNIPNFSDFVAEKIGHRNWYTRSRPAPVKSRGKTYIKPSAWNAMHEEYESLFGFHPWKVA